MRRELAGNEEGTGGDDTKSNATSEKSVESAGLPLPESSFMISIPLMYTLTQYIENGSNHDFPSQIWHLIMTKFIF